MSRETNKPSHALIWDIIMFAGIVLLVLGASFGIVDGSYTIFKIGYSLVIVICIANQLIFKYFKKQCDLVGRNTVLLVIVAVLLYTIDTIFVFMNHGDFSLRQTAFNLLFIYRLLSPFIEQMQKELERGD